MITAVDTDVKATLAALKSKARPSFRIDMEKRFGIVTDNAFGVSMADIKLLGKKLGRDQDLALALWATGVYEARLLASLVGEPAKMTPALMDQWCKDFDNWAVCDTLCFNLFDRTPHAYAKIDKWTKAKPEFVKRAGFALLATMALHDKKAFDEEFLSRFALIEREAEDDRNFVKKAVNWSLRAICTRRSPALKTAATACARRLAQSQNATARWIGKDALRKFTK